jgi:hypothetical protein
MSDTREYRVFVLVLSVNTCEYRIFVYSQILVIIRKYILITHLAARTYFSLKPKSCPDDRARIIRVLQSFVDRAEPWARGKLELFHDAEKLDPYPSYTEFENDVRVTFSSVSRAAEARNAVLSMQPRSRETLGEFLNRFRPRGRCIQPR